MLHWLAPATLCMLLGAGALLSQTRFALEDEKLQARTPKDDALYLPDGRALQAITLGYDRVAANLLWFRTISYFGEHYATDKNFRWLFHMCDLVTTLSPRSKHVYTFGATMLAWESGAPELGMRLLSKAVAQFPDDWYLYYLRGFTALYFLKDRARAKEDFVRAAKLPGAHVVVQRLAARELTQGDTPIDAVHFLTDLLRTTRDPIAREALRERLREAQAALKQQQERTP